jgi:hypothetical protein
VPDDIIVVEGLTVRFGDFTAVDDISLTVRRGEIYGFLGPNGAGKTTTVRAVTTMRRPTSGRIVIDGHDVSVDARRARELIGVCQQNLALDVDISIRENIISKGVLHRISRKELEARMMELSDVIGLTPATPAEVDHWKDVSMASYPIYYMDDSELKMVARGNPAVVYLEDGAIVWKRTLSSLDDVEQPVELSDMGKDLNGDDIMTDLMLIYLAAMLVLVVINRSHLMIRYFYYKRRLKRSKSQQE